MGQPCFHTVPTATLSPTLSKAVHDGAFHRALNLCADDQPVFPVVLPTFKLFLMPLSFDAVADFKLCQI